MESEDHEAAPKDIISDYLDDWVERQYFYQKAANITHDICEASLASNAIRGIVTSRVKRGNRLEAKLRQRTEKHGREYKSFNEIRNDIVDLAGVRIALYFPNDAEKVEKIIGDSFRLIEHKKFPEPVHQGQDWILDLAINSKPSHKFHQRFGGYFADHYRVRVKAHNLADKEVREHFRRSDPIIEIQVASVLMHAWAEIDHDLVYKMLTSGPASKDELRILDATNGLVHTGEVLLQQLQIAMDSRVLYQIETFSDQYQLVAYLRKEQLLKDEHEPMDHIDVLFKILKVLNLDSPLKLGQHLGVWGPTNPDICNPFALLVVERILSQVRHYQVSDSTIKQITLKPRPQFPSHSEIVRTAGEMPFLNTPHVREKILLQINILELTVKIADTIVAPEKSMLVVEDSLPILVEFHKLFANLLYLKHCISKEGNSDENEIPILVEAIDKLWIWFETNLYALYRISLKLARLNVPDIVGVLSPPHLSTTFQRVDSLHPAKPDRSMQFAKQSFSAPTAVRSVNLEKSQSEGRHRRRDRSPEFYS